MDNNEDGVFIGVDPDKNEMFILIADNGKERIIHLGQINHQLCSAINASAFVLNKLFDSHESKTIH